MEGIINLDDLELAVVVTEFDEDTTTSLAMKDNTLYLLIYDGYSFPDEYLYLGPVQLDESIKEIIEYFND